MHVESEAKQLALNKKGETADEPVPLLPPHLIYKAERCIYDWIGKLVEKTGGRRPLSSTCLPQRLDPICLVCLDFEVCVMRELRPRESASV